MRERGGREIILFTEGLLDILEAHYRKKGVI